MSTEEFIQHWKQAGMVIPLSGSLRPDQVCQMLDVCNGTLENWRRKAIGPPAHRVGGRWRYKVADVAAYYESGSVR